MKKKYGHLGDGVLLVQLEKGSDGLGLSLAGHKDRTKMAVFVCGINPNGAAHKSGTVMVGDEILEVSLRLQLCIGIVVGTLYALCARVRLEHEGAVSARVVSTYRIA